MPILENAKQELYCKHRANNFVPRRAAIAAGYATGSAVYSELEKDASIQMRIAELQDEARERKDQRARAAEVAAQTSGQITGVGQAWVIEQLKMNAEDARDAGDFKESNAALIKIGEHLGMWGAGGGENADKAANGVMNALDLDDIERLTRATDHLELPAGGVRVVDTDTVLGLIQGHKPTPRKMATGSETDVANETGVVDAEFEEVPHDD